MAEADPPQKGAQQTTNSQKRSRHDRHHTDAWVSLKALSNSHGRSFAEALEHFTRFANGAELGVRSSVAADIVRRVGGRGRRSQRERAPRR